MRVHSESEPNHFANNIGYIVIISHPHFLIQYNPDMNNSSVHSHPVPISRINSVYCESDASVHNQLGVNPPASLPADSNARLDAAMKFAREYLSRKSIHPAIQIPVKSKRTIGFSELNRSDSTEIKSYSYNLSYTNNCQIASIRKKIELYPGRYNDPIYLSQSQMLLLSPGWANAQRYSCCSMRSSINPSGTCRLHRYCPYCCYLKARDVQLQFVPVFGDSNWHFLTGSFRGSLDMPDSNSCYDWLQYWDAYKSALTKLTDDETIRGFYMVEELAVNRILQPSMLPHIHAIIDADELSESTLDEVGIRLSILSLKCSFTTSTLLMEYTGQHPPRNYRTIIGPWCFGVRRN